MLHYLYADQLHLFPTLRDTMFRDRAKQFHDRLGWDAVTVDENGFERDEYDDLNPLYVIYEREDGTHGGSMRLLPTTGRTMLAEHFSDLTDVAALTSPFVWEITRLCLAPGAEAKVVAALVLALDEMMEGYGLSHMVAVFEASRLRIFRRLGAEPEVLGHSGEGRQMVAVGLWERESYGREARERVEERAGIASTALDEFGEQIMAAAHIRVPEAKVALAA